MPLVRRRGYDVTFLYVLKEFTIQGLLQVAYEKYIGTALFFRSKHANHV